jgi:hypothetical protein
MPPTTVAINPIVKNSEDECVIAESVNFPTLAAAGYRKEPAYALDATYRVMAKTMGGAPQKLPRAG